MKYCSVYSPQIAVGFVVTVVFASIHFLPHPGSENVYFRPILFWVT